MVRPGLVAAQPAGPSEVGGVALNLTICSPVTFAIVLGMSGSNETLLYRRDAEKRHVLQNHYLFGKLSPKHIDRLASCIVGKSVPRASTIFAKGDPGSSLFVICKGAVKIAVPSVNGHDAVFNLIGQGHIFGEIALLDGRPRTADAIATTDCELFVIERRDFLPLLREEPEIAVKLIETLCARLRQTTDQAENLMFLSLPGRLAKALLHLSDGEGDACERKAAVTQKDLGNIIGMSRESTNRQLRIWEEHKWVRLGRGGIIILSVKALERIAESDSAAGWVTGAKLVAVRRSGSGV
jgi:CRP/FNR family transcriptional regulator, cyclic AMP receptor protein